MSILIAIPLGFIYAEVVGYFVHILLHSEKFPSLARAHMLHHLRDYGPDKPYFTEEYVESTRDRASFLGGIGFEWFVPIGLTIGLTLGTLTLLGASWMFQLAFMFGGLFWGYTAFSYMHSAMHIKGFWMLKNPYLRKWFNRARRLHWIHHQNVGTDGRMMTNFGICFYGVDRIMGTLADEVTCDTEKGFEQAEITYADVIK